MLACRMRRGITISEVVVVVTLIALCTLVGVPRIANTLAGLTAEHEARRIAMAHSRARIMALASGRVMLLRLAPDTLSISEIEAGDTLRRWFEPGPASAGAELTGPTRYLRFTPTGITFGLSNGTWTVTYRGAMRRVVASRLGRVRVMR